MKNRYDDVNKDVGVCVNNDDGSDRAAESDRNYDGGDDGDDAIGDIDDDS